MFRRFSLIIALAFFSTVAVGADLYQVWIESENDAEILRTTGATAVTRTADGYLVLADDASLERLDQSGLKIAALATGIETDDLAFDIALDNSNVGKYPTVYEENNLRLFRVDGGVPDRADGLIQLSPVPIDGLPIEYYRPMTYNPRAISTIVGLDSLIGLISQDSLISYTERLQAFMGRVVGSDSNMASSEWLKTKFESFGYDSVVFDTFSFNSSSGSYTGRNVICTKPGGRYAPWTLIVGAHMDAVPGSPGANDNGSGTAGVLEVARVLAEIETDVTFKFMTFDGEEFGLHGAWNVANRAAAEGEPIIYMLNMDMIAHYTNTDNVKLFHGAETAYSRMWSDLADSLVGLNGILYGTSGGSDHYPFQQNGFAVTFVHEYIFSSVYHSPQDSTSYMNFDYMTRNVQASLATAYAANLLTPPAVIADLVDSGSGEALRVDWIPMDPDRIDHFWLYYYPSYDPGLVDSVMLPGSASSHMVTGLIEDVEYAFYILPYDSEGQTSIEYIIAYGIPHSSPSELEGLTATTKVKAIELTWNKNPELDIDHYRIVRNSDLQSYLSTADTMYLDDDPGLGTDVYTYQVMAVDGDGHLSALAWKTGVTGKAAQLEMNRILAVNRSLDEDMYLVDEVETGEFMRQALAGFEYDYYSDTAYLDIDNPDQLNFFDLIDYELVIVGGESAFQDDFGGTTGILDTLEMYMALGGKVIIFGRWGWLDFETTYEYDMGSTDYEYNSLFDISSRTLPLTTSSGAELISDMIGAHGQLTGYPDLVWDSLAVLGHSTPFTDVLGIPCVSYPALADGVEILYRYNSIDDGGPTEGRPLAWRRDEPNYQYVYFEIPLSFVERSAAVTALNQAVIDFGFPAALTLAEPDTVDVLADETATIELLLGNLAGNRAAGEINTASIVVNDSHVPLSVGILTSHPDFDGAVCQISVSSSELAGDYEPLLGQATVPYTIAWHYTGESLTLSVQGEIVVLGHSVGDGNGDGQINVGDAVYLISYVFRSGPAPYPSAAGDANCDEDINVGDAVYLINYIFKNGPPPCAVEEPSGP